ncbi:MAG: pyridoxal phosphate-dependent aminotransferase [Proteobacteria bacterium]|nr:pyridoxal phosphate-dependent aminotransferase [Pseudomonadota bacterium]
MKNIFAKRVSKLNPSPTLALDAKIKDMIKNGIEVISFGVGEPDFDTPQYIKEAGKKAIDEGLTKYTPAGGTESLKRAVCMWYKREYGVDINPSMVVVSNGAKHSLFNIALALIDRGDEVIIPSPYWVSYPEQVSLVGGKPVFIKTTIDDNFKVTPKKLKESITDKTKAIIISSPSNPTGAVYFKEELSEILKIAKKYNFYLIFDEIYDKLVYDEKFYSILELIKDDKNLKDRVIVVNGVSKSYAMTGWRIGYTISNDKLAKVMNDIQSQTTSNPSSISQRAAEIALTEKTDDLKKMVSEFKKRRDLIFKLISDIPDVRVHKPEGSFYIFPDFSKYLGRKDGKKVIKTTLDLADYLLQNAKSGVVPGEAFGAPGYLRFSFANSSDKIKKGIGNIKEALLRLL